MKHLTHYYVSNQGLPIEASARSHDSPSTCCGSSSIHEQTEDDKQRENVANNS